jgi:hypothetical protein
MYSSLFVASIHFDKASLLAQEALHAIIILQNMYVL